MTCHVCANPTCVDDCQHFPPPPLKIGSAEHKLQELLKIADEMSKKHMESDECHPPWCIHCGANYNYATKEVIHKDTCPILKLEQFKASLT